MNNKSLVSLSFDDGRSDNTDIYDQILKPNRIPATFNIATAYIENNCPKESIPSKTISPMKKRDIIRIYNDGICEIALHGRNHTNDFQDIFNCYKDICEWIGRREDFGFASPGSGMDLKEFIDSDNEYVKNDLVYLRTHYRYNGLKTIKVFFRKVARVTHIPILFRIAYEDTAMDSCYNRILYSVPILKDTTLKEISSLLKYCIRKNKSIILMFHSITTDIEHADNFSWSNKNFSELCNLLKRQQEEGMISIVTTKQMYRELKENE